MDYLMHKTTGKYFGRWVPVDVSQEEVGTSDHREERLVAFVFHTVPNWQDKHQVYYLSVSSEISVLGWNNFSDLQLVIQPK